MLDDSEAVVNESQGHIDELLTDVVIASLHTDTQTYQDTDRQTDRQTDRVDRC